MACSSYNNTSRSNCDPNLEATGTGCVSNWGALSESGYDFCEFAGYGGCSSVCGCNYIWRCFKDCGSYTAASDTPRVVLDNRMIEIGQIIEASEFNYIVDSLNAAMQVLNYNYRYYHTFNAGDLIEASELKPILTTYNKPFNTTTEDRPYNCNSTYTSNPRLDETMVETGRVIKAYDWNTVYRHLQYLSTCCHCVSDYVLVCGSVCVCSCYY